MTTTLQRIACAAMGLMLLFFVGACAKRPVALEPAAHAVPAPGPPPTQAEAPPAAPAPPPVTAVEPAPPPEPTPAAAPRPEPKEFRAHDALKTIYFDFDKVDIRASDAKILDASAAWLKTNPTYLLLIEGHCDERGTSDYNLVLGDRRANAAKVYLTDRGISSDRVSVVSLGEERPACTEPNSGCWAKNRRAQFFVKEE
jgi:peptidoglycan-associated lipoprotein